MGSPSCSVLSRSYANIFLLIIFSSQCTCVEVTAASAQAPGAPPADIRFTDQTYRRYVGSRDPKHPWHDGVDVLTKRGYSMTAVQAAVVDGSISTSMGSMGVSADPPFILQDFYQAYKLDTVWPYCDSIRKCLVYVQQDSPAAPKAPVNITLPPGVSAVDLYIDAAIDCVKTLRAVVKCKAIVEPGSVEVKFRFSSICASPFVGKYIGFFDESGDSISSLQLRCKSTAPTALGLVRIGTKQQQDIGQVQQL